MRIIAGEFGGRRILPPPTEATRPITDRAKQSLFDALGDRVEGANVLDAFAGTGSMGLECVSRGARRVVFVERDRGALLCLRKNVEALGIAGQSVVLPIDAYRAVFHHAVKNDGPSQSTWHSSILPTRTQSPDPSMSGSGACSRSWPCMHLPRIP